ncbi:hypothetical protein [Nocardioides sp. cx-173]|nr:hypothetical protein [Nocardioides sp. cx-173]MCD4524322.1 hypothetical protein [Nocardioides sp. cx-173]UGB41711.1 hypothetical protein LQ940_20445 [Nocardioides sp. cx-173]
MMSLHHQIDTEARHRIAERVAKASTPSLPSRRARRTARSLRAIADRLDS